MVKLFAHVGRLVRIGLDDRSYPAHATFCGRQRRPSGQCEQLPTGVLVGSALRDQRGDRGSLEQWLPNAIQAGTAVGQLYLGLSARRQQQAAEWGELLADLADLDGAQLRRIVEENPVVAELVGIAWEAAARTASEDKRYLLAQVAASALRGDTLPEQVDRRPVLALDPPHITLLVLIPEHVDRTGRNPNPAERMTEFPDLTANWPGGERLLGPALAALEGQGLIEIISDHNGSARWCKLRPFGGEFLDYLLVDAGGWPPRRESERRD